MPSEINAGGGFIAEALGTVKSYSLSLSSSPLVLAPPSGKVIRLSSLSGSAGGVSIEVGGDTLISGDLDSSPSNDNEFNINAGAGSNGITGIKDQVASRIIDQSISISTTSVAASSITYTVDYGRIG